MFDCGNHPAYNGMDSLPYFDAIDASTIDALLITHFHLDHCASFPYLLQNTNFKGRVPTACLPVPRPENAVE